MFDYLLFATYYLSIMFNSLRQDEIAAIKNKCWQLDCSQMKLVRNDFTHALEGPGYIRMEPDGSLAFKLYFNEPMDEAQGLMWLSERFGRLIPTNKCYKLTANDSYGRMWEATNVLPNTRFVIPSNAPVSGDIYLPLKGFFNSDHKLAHGQLSFVCFENYNFPFNSATTKYHDEDGKPIKIGWSLDTAKFEVDELDFFLTNRDDQFLISITSKTPSIASIVEMRAIEALQFLLGRAIDWRICVKHENGVECIVIRCAHPVATAIHPPIRYRGPKGAEYWQLYTKYFEYICQNKDKDSWHPISTFIHRILEARKASIEMQCLALSVVVEGLLRTEFGAWAKPSEDLLNWIDKAKNILNLSSPPPSIINRLGGAINSMKRASASDQLQELLKQAIITKKEKDTWSKLRNSSTHPERAFFENYKDAIDAFDTVLTLFYKLIFYRIGYCGKYTDYRTPDMQDAIFPTKPEFLSATEK